jgi:mono/diheme cytochrome c family protein
MPYTYYTRVSRDDVLSIHGYLETVPAISNSVSADQLPFPLSVRADMAAWNALYFKSGEFYRCEQEGGMESRRVSGGRADALRHVSYTEEYCWR